MLTDSALPATLTAIHLAIAALRRHRARGGSLSGALALLSFPFAATPWIWPSLAGLAIGLGAHLVWVVACELVAPVAPLRPPPTAPGPRGTQASDSAPARATAGFVTTSVVSVLEETSDVRTFRLVRPSGFDFLPGQFVAVRVQIDGKPHVRCYSISSAPDTRGYIEISVRRQGLVSTTLHATLRTGSSVTINRPSGTFVYPAADDRPLALIAGGIGITPLMSMLRHAISSDPTRPVVLLYSARRDEDLAFASELRVIAERHPQVRVALTVTRPDAETRARIGRVDAVMVRQFVRHPAHTIFCVCGPAQMIADVERMLAAVQVPASQIRFERFEASAAAAALNFAAADRSVAGPAEAGAATAPGYRVAFSLSGRSAEVPAAQTLLDAADAAGIPITSSCRSGVCQSCRTRLLSGDAECRSDLLDSTDRAEGYILPCVSWARADCVLEA